MLGLLLPYWVQNSVFPCKIAVLSYYMFNEPYFPKFIATCGSFCEKKFLTYKPALKLIDWLHCLKSFETNSLPKHLTDVKY